MASCFMKPIIRAKDLMFYSEGPSVHACLGYFRAVGTMAMEKLSKAKVPMCRLSCTHVLSI